MKSVLKASLKTLDRLAEELAGNLKGGEILALVGNLGAGKTTFTQKLARKLKVKASVLSPTFVLMNLFKAKLKNGRPITLYHLDLYRTRDFAEVKALGITEFWGQKNSVTVIEWADKIKKHLPKNAIVIYFQN
ncbi:MAG: tRNA (adenosine(37)-N6)-threonylcarbamoyltransferase complex ATPase subunit type 1 TsaE [Patescibacteria group bacterium]|nr:tRNA (adenosine(37)-N6)-threonylcarbamoyltransferase complex ATPase subunit type 1 TsaE [Patescibacteria group bacterium]